MGVDPIVLLVIIGTIAALAAVCGYYILRYEKGSITISMPTTRLSHDGQAEGSFELLTRKEVKGNKLTAALVATETIRERDNTRSHDISRTILTLEQAKVYPAGYRAEYNFIIPVPSLQGQADGESLLGRALDLLSSAGRSISWKVEVRLDAEGVDLSASQSVTVNGSKIF